jgi:hypothetical protein
MLPISGVIDKRDAGLGRSINLSMGLSLLRIDQGGNVASLYLALP